MAFPYIPGLTEIGDALGFGDAGSEKQKQSEAAWDELGNDPSLGPQDSRYNKIWSWATQAVNSGDITPEVYQDILSGRANPLDHGFRPGAGDENIYLTDPTQGSLYDPAHERFVDPGASAWAGTEAILPGASKWDDLEALDAGESAWGSIDWDRAGAGAQRDAMGYISGELASDSVGRRTAAAESEWERQRQVADQQARAHREAGLRDLEMRGQGGGGAALGAMLAGEQDRSMSRHGAGLDFLSIVDALEAQERGRRDNLAATGADIGSRYDTSQFGQASDIATGTDAWSEWTTKLEDDFRREQAREQDRREREKAEARADHQRDKAAGLDDYGIKRADMEQGVETRTADRTNEGSVYNIDRERDVIDRIADNRKLEELNRADLPGRRFDRKTTVTAGKSGQYQAGADAKRDQSGRLLNTAAGLVKGAAAAKGG